jgi:CBS domain-containing protein
MMMKTVGQLLDEKGHEVVSVRPADSVMVALSLMSQRNVGALLVMDGETLVGIFSERDYARKMVLYGGSGAAKVQDLMTAKVIHATPDKTLDECMTTMTAGHFRHMPVLDGGKVVGVISSTDLIRETISEQDFAAEQFR